MIHYGSGQRFAPLKPGGAPDTRRAVRTSLNWRFRRLLALLGEGLERLSVVQLIEDESVDHLGEPSSDNDVPTSTRRHEPRLSQPSIFNHIWP